MPISSSSEILRRKLNLKLYIDELTALIGYPVHAGDLGTLEQAARMREVSQKFETQPRQACEILFSERCSDRFKRFVQSLHDVNPSSVYIWTPRTIVCGALVVPSITAIKFDFDFTIHKDGILAFLTRDMEDRLLLDFSVSPNNNQIMKVETQGPNWARVVY